MLHSLSRTEASLYQGETLGYIAAEASSVKKS